ncbi:MAG: BrnA antitoxin family protein [Myxococcota bacterium]
MSIEQRDKFQRPVQYFSASYLESCRKMTPIQICEFLDSFRIIAAGQARPRMPRKLISLRVQESVLTAFKQKSKQLGVPYQSQIQRLMEEWVKKS